MILCRKCNATLKDTMYQGSSIAVIRKWPLVGITSANTLDIDFEEVEEEDSDWIESWYECIACGEEYTYEEALNIQKEIQEILQNEQMS